MRPPRDRWPSLVAGDVALATLVPMSPEFEPAPCQHAPGQPYVLSRFAYTRADRGETVLECPLSHARIILHDWRAVAAVHGLARPSRPADLSAAIPGLSCDTATALLGLLVAARMAGEPSGEGAALDEACPALRTWEFHDLLFHARSRAGRHDHPIGGTYRLAGQMPPPPVLKPPPSHGWTDLHRPDLERLEREDPPFARVQEARRSIRDFGTSPLSDRQLGEFLYRVGRVADYWEAPVATPRGPVAMAFAPRPYPAGGSLYELELYVTVRACQGLEAGLYHYDPGRHGLARLPAATADLDQLLADAGRAVGVPPERLQVLVVVAARFPRIAWKYASIAYSLLLKHVGVLYQTMYLVATAMNLAPCAVGCGNADLFARAAGTDYYAETSVGEFLLGSRP